MDVDLHVLEMILPQVLLAAVQVIVEGDVKLTVGTHVVRLVAVVILDV